jgi:uncharacterized protein involved in exopolysaccharide biosynthesis
MRQQESLSFIEVCLQLVNANLKHFKLFSAIVAIPTITMFVLVMWVIDPVYRATAIVTPPSSMQSSIAGGINSILGSTSKSGLSGLSSMLNLSAGSDDADVVWTIFNSWELHEQVIREFDLARHYKFKGKYAADLLKKFRKNFDIESNKESMFEITMEDKDYKLAAQMIDFMLEKADSAFNAYKTSQARQSRLYLQSRLDSCERNLKALLKKFAKFQADNNFYDPEIQMESTIKYLSELQGKREDLSMELAYEKDDRGERSKRYDQLSKRYHTVNTAMQGTLDGKNKDLGMVSLKKSPKLNAEYLQYDTEIKIQSALYQMLRVQKEELQIEEAKQLTNLHILEPPWENNKKVFPIRGAMLIFAFALSVIIGTIVCNLLDYLGSEEEKGSKVAKQWLTFKGLFRRNKGH